MCVYRASLLGSDREYRRPLGGEVPGRHQGSWAYRGLPATSELRLLLDSWNQSVHCPTIEEDIGPETWEGEVWPNCLCSGFPVCWSQGEEFATAAPWQGWGTRERWVPLWSFCHQQVWMQMSMWFKSIISLMRNQFFLHIVSRTEGKRWAGLSSFNGFDSLWFGNQ